MIVDHADHGGYVDGLGPEAGPGVHNERLHVGGDAMLPGILSPEALDVLFRQAGITVHTLDQTGPGPAAPERMLYATDNRPTRLFND
jgi:hypothetical protein